MVEIKCVWSWQQDAFIVFIVFFLQCREVMSHPVSVFNMRESVGRVMEVLKTETHNGFPVVEDYIPNPLDVSFYVFMIFQEINGGISNITLYLCTFIMIIVNIVFELQISWSRHQFFSQLQNFTKGHIK